MPRPGRDHHMATDEGVFFYLDTRPVHKVCTTMPRNDPHLREALLVLLWRRIGEGALETNQIRPADGQTGGGDALGLHAMTPVHRFGNAHQHFLGVAPAQLACPPGRESTMATLQPASRQAYATVCAAAPVPSTITSTVVTVVPPICAICTHVLERDTCGPVGGGDLIVLRRERYCRRRVACS